MIALDAEPRDIAYVLANLREHTRREMSAVRWDASPQTLEEEYARLSPACIKHFAFFEDEPVVPIALLGAWLAAPGVALLRMIATDQWPLIGVGVYRWIGRIFIPCVLEPNVRRAETRVLDQGPATRRWLYRLGFRDEGIARSFGSRGEDYVHVAWINPRGVACVNSSASYSAEVRRSCSG